MSHELTAQQVLAYLEAHPDAKLADLTGKWPERWSSWEMERLLMLCPGLVLKYQGEVAHPRPTPEAPEQPKVMGTWELERYLDANPGVKVDIGPAPPPPPSPPA